MKKQNSLDPVLVRRLLAAGCPIPSEGSDEPQVAIKIEVSRPEVTIAYDRRAGTEYVFGLRVTNCSYSRLELQAYRARFDWAAHLNWLSDPRVHVPEKKVYRLESGREFPCGEVLNHRVCQQGSLNPGDTVEGILLARTIFDRIPFDYIHGTTASADLCVTDQYGRRHCSPIEFSIDRRATMRPRVFRPLGTGLFDKPEPKSHAAVPQTSDHATRGRKNVTQ